MIEEYFHKGEIYLAVSIVFLGISIYGIKLLRRIVKLLEGKINE